MLLPWLPPAWSPGVDHLSLLWAAAGLERCSRPSLCQAHGGQSSLGLTAPQHSTPLAPFPSSVHILVNSATTKGSSNDLFGFAL